VLIVAVEHDEGEVRLLAGDQLDRLLDGHRERRHLVAQRVERVAERAQILLALVGQKDPDVLLARSACGVGHFGNRLLHCCAPRPSPPPDGRFAPRPSARPPSDERSAGPWSI
jgi:hypothetical protein